MRYVVCGMRFEYRVLARHCPDGGLLIQRLSQCLAHRRRRRALSFVFPAFSGSFRVPSKVGTKEYTTLNPGHLRFLPPLAPRRRRLSRAHGCICIYSPLITYSS